MSTLDQQGQAYRLSVTWMLRWGLFRSDPDDQERSVLFALVVVEDALVGRKHDSYGRSLGLNW